MTGAGTLTDDSSTYLAPVAVPTDVGAYLVLLSRRGQGWPWLVERFTPPETVTTREPDDLAGGPGGRPGAGRGRLRRSALLIPEPPAAAAYGGVQLANAAA